MSQLNSQQDASLQISQACPAAAANVTSNFFDFLGGDPSLASGVNVPRTIEFLLSIPALPNNEGTGDNVTVTIEDSADGVTFNPITELAAVVVTGVAATGSAAISNQYRMPPTTRRYLAIEIAATSGAGNNTASSVTFAPVFP